MSNSIASPSRRFHVEWFGLGVLWLLLGIALSYALHREYNSVEAQESDRLQAQARVVDENLIRQLEGANNALTGSVMNWNAWGLEVPRRSPLADSNC